jgi:5-(carboxyamino)imidazole ribonucleotide mutase
MPDSPRVAVICGSRSDLPSLKGCFDVLDSYGIAWEASVISAHRQADALHAYVADAEADGVKLFIGAAGLAAHLPGVLASLTAKPVIGIPLDGGALGGADALYAVVQMPPGVPVATVAIGSAGAKNAGHLAARILALSDEAVAQLVAAFRDDQATKAELRIDPRAAT